MNIRWSLALRALFLLTLLESGTDSWAAPSDAKRTVVFAPMPNCGPAYARIQQVGAQSTHPLPSILKRATEVELEGKVLDTARLRSAARIIDISGGDVGEGLANLPNGQYIYGIDTKMRLVVIPRNMGLGKLPKDHPDAEFLGSHEGIRALLQDIDGNPVEFLATGEITIRAGRVLDVSNGAGSYKGGTEHLLFARDRLAFAKLPIDARTQYRDYSIKRYPEPHGQANGQVRLEIDFLKDPRNRQLLQHVHRITQLVANRVWDPATLLIDATFDPRFAKDRASLNFAGQFAGQWWNPQDGDAYLVRQYVQTMGETDFRKMLGVIADVLRRSSSGESLPR